MSAQDTGGPAFPHQISKAGYPLQGGMTLRQYYAGQALAGLCATMGRMERADIADDELRGVALGVQFAQTAFALADAMLDEEATP